MKGIIFSYEEIKEHILSKAHSHLAWNVKIFPLIQEEWLLFKGQHMNTT
jgi:hypothetical protein